MANFIANRVFRRDVSGRPGRGADEESSELWKSNELSRRGTGEQG